MPRTKSTTALDTGARDAAAKQLAEAEAAAAAALTAKHDAAIAAIDPHIDAVNTPPAGVVIKGNQGR
jgi:hypothetical protein